MQVIAWIYVTYCAIRTILWVADVINAIQVGRPGSWSVGVGPVVALIFAGRILYWW